MLESHNVIDLVREGRKGLGKLTVFTAGTCALPDQTDQRFIHVPARRA